MTTARTPLPEWLTDNLPEQAAAPAEARANARLQVTDWGLPTLRDEEWRWTNLRPIQRARFSLATTGPSAEQPAGDNALVEALPDALVFEFRDGALVSRPDTLPAGVDIKPLAQADEATRQAAFAPEAKNANDALLALNTAAAQHGLVIEVAANQQIEQPILLHWLDGVQAESMSQTRVLIRLGQSAEARVIEQVGGPDDSPSWRNAVTVIDLAANARLTHIGVGVEGNSRLLTARDEARLARDAQLSSINIQLGGRLVRREINVDITESGAHCDLLGLMMPRDRQLLDTHTRITHGAANTTSNEHYRTIADETGRGVFKGRILVARDAQKIEAFQSSNNLLLSDDAEIDTKPELEIYADDVKCSHGATIGRLDDDALYYLRSRGLSQTAARSLLIFGFANEVLDAIKHESLNH